MELRTHSLPALVTSTYKSKDSLVPFSRRPFPEVVNASVPQVKIREIKWLYRFAAIFHPYSTLSYFPLTKEGREEGRKEVWNDTGREMGQEGGREGERNCVPKIFFISVSLIAQD